MQKVSRKRLFVLPAAELLEKGEKNLPGKDRQSPQSGDTSFSSCHSLRVSLSLQGSWEMTFLPKEFICMTERCVTLG